MMRMYIYALPRVVTSIVMLDLKCMRTVYVNCAGNRSLGRLGRAREEEQG
jgi:hypothetical protein